MGGVVVKYHEEVEDVNSADFVSTSLSLIRTGYITYEQFEGHLPKLSTVVVRESCELLHQLLQREKLDKVTHALMRAMFITAVEDMADRSYICEIGIGEDGGMRSITFRRQKGSEQY